MLFLLLHLLVFVACNQTSLFYFLPLISFCATQPSIVEWDLLLQLYKHLTIFQWNELNMISSIRFTTVPDNTVLCHTGFAIQNSHRTPSSSVQRIVDFKNDSGCRNIMTIDSKPTCTCLGTSPGLKKSRHSEGSPSRPARPLSCNKRS